MFINSKQEFINQIKAFNIGSEYAVVKPNWVSNKFGEYTELEILEWLFEAIPNQKKIIIESYTPWRGLKFEGDNRQDVHTSLNGGKNYWNFYKEQDRYFLESTGIAKVLGEYGADYINITNEVWSNRCVEAGLVEQLVKDKRKSIKWREFYSYIPKRLYEIRNRSILISLSKIKIEEGIPAIFVSMSVKNLFGLIPHPSRWIPFHEKDHAQIPEVIHDIYTVYTCLFNEALWITEGIKTLARNYCEPNQEIVTNQNLFFVGKDAKKVDSEACEAMGINPQKVPYLQLL
jgi:hypothetical protein